LRQACLEFGGIDLRQKISTGPTLTGILLTIPETREPTSISAPTTGRITPVASTV
jgi:hypothetical protein